MALNFEVEAVLVRALEPLHAHQCFPAASGCLALTEAVFQRAMHALKVAKTFQ